MKGFEKREDLSFGGKEIGSVEKEFLFFIFFQVLVLAFKRRI